MPTETEQTWGQHVKARRLELDLTQQELAERAGLTQQHLSLIEVDKVSKPRYHTLKRLAEALDTTIEALDP